MLDAIEENTTRKAQHNASYTLHTLDGIDRVRYSFRYNGHATHDRYCSGYRVRSNAVWYHYTEVRKASTCTRSITLVS